MNTEIKAKKKGEELLNMSQAMEVKSNSRVTVSALIGGRVKLTRVFDAIEIRSRSSGNPLSMLWGGKSDSEETVTRLDTTMFDSMATSYTFSR